MCVLHSGPGPQRGPSHRIYISTLFSRSPGQTYPTFLCPTFRRRRPRAESSGCLLKERRDEVRMCRLSVFSANCIAGTAGLHFRRCISSGAGGNDNRPGLCAIDRAVVLGEFTLRKGFKLIFDPGFRVYDLFWWL